MKRAALMFAAILLGAVALLAAPCRAETNCKTIKCLNGALDAAKAEASTADQKIRDELARQAAEIEKLKAGAPAPQPPAPSARPKMQLGLDFLAYYSFEEPFNNALRANGCAWTAIDAQGTLPNLPCRELVAQGHVDPATLLPVRIPAGYEVVRSGIFHDPQATYPKEETWIACWDGKAKLRTQSRVLSANCSAFDFPATYRDHSYLDFVEIGAGFANPRIYRESDKAAAEAGAVFQQRFLDYAKRYDVLRFMNWQQINTSWIRTAEQLATKAQFGWGGSPNLLDGNGAVTSRTIPSGVPLEVMTDLCVATETECWLHYPPYLGAPAALDDRLVFTGEPPQPPNNPLIQQIAKANVSSILASPEWRKYSDAVVRALVASGYPKAHILYVELANEVWNTQPPFWRATRYFDGLGSGLAAGKWRRYALGYATANMAVHLDAALKDAGREQAVVFVLAGQNADPATTADALEGFKAYFATKGIDAKPYLARLGVSTASYYFGALDEPAVAAVTGETSGAFADRWLAAIAKDPAALSKRATDYLVNGPASQHGSIAWAAANRAAHQKIAEEAGAFFLGDYEGESHETGGGALRSHPAFVNWAESWRDGPEGERVTKAWAAAMTTQNGKAILSNFIGVCARDPEGAAADDHFLEAPWCDAYYGEETGRTRALAPLLRP